MKMVRKLQICGDGHYGSESVALIIYLFGQEISQKLKRISK